MAEEINIGTKVQEFRKKSGMSLRELAGQAKLSPSMLSQIESNSVNPSINTLKNIAQVLHVPLYQFFKESTQTDQLIVHKGENRVIGQVGQEVLYKLLTPDVSGAIEFCLMDIPSGAASSDILREHIGEEVAYIISGEVDLYINDSVHHLHEGDAVKIPPLSPHRWVNRYGQDFQAVFAITPPSF